MGPFCRQARPQVHRPSRSGGGLGGLVADLAKPSDPRRAPGVVGPSPRRGGKGRPSGSARHDARIQGSRRIFQLMSDDRSRSREGLERGQQLYAVIEFCTDPETLWGKIASGHWDWLGVRQRQDGRRHFVMGSPPVSRLKIRAFGQAVEIGTSRDYRTTIEEPDSHGGTSERWYRSAEDAAAGFARIIEELESGRGTSGLFRVRLYQGEQLLSAKLVVRAWPNEL
jgi:hypothetical protein